MASHLIRAAVLPVIATLLVVVVGSPAATQDVGALVKEGTRLERAGDFAESLTLFRKAVTADPSSFEARYALGRSLDLAGRYAEAREHLGAALELADPGVRDMVLSALAVSHAFAGNTSEAARYYTQQFEAQRATGQTNTAAATANALARMYLEAEEVDAAERWYRTGYETGLKSPGLTDAQRDLWEFRWQNARGRIAARRGRSAEARTAVEAARAVLDRGGNPDQEQYYPYLAGYVHFFEGRYGEAIDELSDGNLDDPFVAGLIAQAYEKLGDRAKARDYYQMVMASNSHSLNAAYSRPIARAFLQK